ncbi:MAG TPA: energy-coupling factor transporter ATPase, partial [Clostridiales bacterium]|nr:energy-coupling factor transporter ATPase [Clostridiales bacterium]
IGTIKRLNKELGITVVLVTHFMDEAVLADRIIVMNDGTIVKDGTPAEVFSDVKTIKESGLELPIGANMAERLKKSGINLGKGILTAEDFATAFSQFVVNNR